LNLRVTLQIVSGGATGSLLTPLANNGQARRQSRQARLMSTFHQRQPAPLTSSPAPTTLTAANTYGATRPVSAWRLRVDNAHGFCHHHRQRCPQLPY